MFRTQKKTRNNNKSRDFTRRKKMYDKRKTKSLNHDFHSVNFFLFLLIFSLSLFFALVIFSHVFINLLAHYLLDHVNLLVLLFSYSLSFFLSVNKNPAITLLLISIHLIPLLSCSFCYRNENNTKTMLRK